MGVKVKSGKVVQSENSIHYQVAQYLKIQFRHILFHTDMAGELHTEAQRWRMAKVQKGTGWPDLFIAHPIGNRHGLFIEIKRDRSEVYKVDGTLLADSHIAAQNQVLNHLRGLGYASHFGCGFDECKEIIDNYLTGQ